MSKVIFIVGASSGFGYDLAVQLLQKGHTVYAAARRVERLKSLEDLGATVGFVDVQNQESIDSFVSIIKEKSGRIDVLYNNAGYGYYGPVEHDLTDIEKQFDINVFGMARVQNAVLPIMREQRSGRVVITASVASHVTMAGLGWYSATKHALKAMAEAMRLELLPYGIKVVQIEPGVVETGFQSTAESELLDRNVLSDYKKAMERFRKTQENNYKRAASTNSTIKAMLRAGLAVKPNMVYRTTYDAKLLPIVRKLLPTSWYTWLVSKVIR